MKTTTHLGWATCLVVLSACSANDVGDPVMDTGTDGGATARETANPPTLVHLDGAVQKGPFVVGSTTQVANLDALANPTGAVFTTATKDDLGEFALDLPASDLTAIESSGYYYNEATGSLSVSPLTLRALYHLDGAAPQSAFVNVVTHLTFDREKTLIVNGASFAAARAQAERELQAALAIVPGSFSPGANGVSMNLLGGDSDGNAYLFAASAALATAAQQANPASPDAALQELLNQISLDLAETGTIDASRRARVVAALNSMDTGAIEARFASRLTELGSSATIPSLDRILDQDGDGVPNDSDDCPRVANPSQSDLDRDGVGDACDGDRDGDGVANETDALPDDPLEWADSDGVPDSIDNCLGLNYVGQQDTDQDGVGDACDQEDDTSWCMVSEEGLAQCSSTTPDPVLLICTDTVWKAATTCDACSKCSPGSIWGASGSTTSWVCDPGGHIRRWDPPNANDPLPADTSSLPLDPNPPCWIQAQVLVGRGTLGSGR